MTDVDAGAPPRARTRPRLTRSQRLDRRLRGGRLIGIDLARFLALAGMMAAHVWNTEFPDGDATLIHIFVQGRAAALFAVLAGIGIALSTRRYLTGEVPTRDSAGGRASALFADPSNVASVRARAGTGFGAASRALLMRGFVIALIGLTLGLLDSGIAIILVYYGVTFWLAIPFLRLPVRALFGIAAVWALVWPVVSFGLRTAWGVESTFENPSWQSVTDPDLVRDLFVTGVYPVLTWIVYVLVGMGVGRLITRAMDASGPRDAVARDIRPLMRVALRTLIAGAVLAVAGWGLSQLALGPLGGLDAIARGDMYTPGVMGRIEAQSMAEGSGFGLVPLDSPWWLASSLVHSGATLDLALTTGTSLIAIAVCLMIGLVVRGAGAKLLAPVAAAGAAPLTVYCAHIVAKTVMDSSIPGDRFSAGEEYLWLVSSPQLWLMHVAGALAIGLVLTLLGRSGPLETLVRWLSRQAALPLKRG
ncbi:heparan-alpha-glucosaminide N-acetyltransferase domain-containing protein [Okibacterium fritillariae]|uniref:heparan-alpha-glucosaminide N-acetyltransferase domain-containing protein n=1 Tax=Okibacterium fritillariae TaxID=123320 RepID=UPI00405539E7